MEINTEPGSSQVQAVWQYAKINSICTCFRFQGDTLISPPSFLRSSVFPAPGTMVTVLKSRSTVAIPMQFQPKDERLKTSLFLIR